MNLQGFSPGQRLENLYEDVFDDIYPQIKNQKKGVLSTVIYLILTPEDSKAKQICNDLKIESNALLSDDLSISSDIIGLFISNPNDKKQWIIEPLKEGVKNARKSFGSNLEDNDMKLFQIVVIGCFIVGTVSCFIYLKKKQEDGENAQKENHKNSPFSSPPPPNKVSITVALCLIVPASVVENIRENSTINVSDIETLIENASYFLCTSIEDADTTQKFLELTPDDITELSEQREVYIRINIADGEEMIGKKVKYSLKRNLPNNKGVVRKLACLKYLSVSGLEKFNRI
ncbi:MAG: hypothetical protein ACKO11_17145 [Cuspidothrix sp.]